MSNNDNYEVNFFKPLSEHARGNKKLISRLAIIWAIAVFGFHFLLIYVTTPTPEQTLKDFNTVWPQVVEADSTTQLMHHVFSKSVLMVLGKNIALKDNHREILREALSWSVLSLQADSVKQNFINASKEDAIKIAKNSIGLEDEGFDIIMSDLLTTSLVKVETTELSMEVKEELQSIMDLYLIHNRSFLTDTKFLGFPFHYWYTAQFLLILFVLLCLVYAVSIDKLNEKHEFIEET